MLAVWIHNNSPFVAKLPGHAAKMRRRVSSRALGTGRVTGDIGLGPTDVIEALCELFVSRGIPTHIRSDNGPEFVAEALRDWIATVGARTAYIERGSPWENGYCESFNGKLRDELLNGEIFYTLKEAQIVIENWRRHYNTARPHSSLGYRPPAPAALVWPAPKEIVKMQSLN
jgi:putative transposase